jgi:hypothetical protein
MYTLYGCVDGVILLVQYCFSCSCSCLWGETVFLNCRHQRTYCSSTRWYMNMEGHGGMILTWENQRTRRKIQPSATLSDIWVLRVIIELYWHGKNQSCLRKIDHSASLSDIWVLRVIIELYWRGKNQSSLRKIDHSASLSTKNLTCTDSGANSALRDERPSTNRLHGVIYFCRKAYDANTVIFIALIS